VIAHATSRTLATIVETPAAVPSSVAFTSQLGGA